MPRSVALPHPPVCRLVGHETNAQRSCTEFLAAPAEQPDEIASTFRHSGWQPIREKVAASIQRIDGFSPRLNRFRHCGEDAWIVRRLDDPSIIGLAGNACRDRFCLPCAQWRASRVASALRAHVQDRPVLFVTLTLADAWMHDDGAIASVAPAEADRSSWTRIPLQDLLAKLYRSFSALRRCDFWKQEVKGGAAFLELKWQPRLERWHPHLHLMIEARFVPQDQLRAAWFRITKTSNSIDIQRVRDRDNAVNECCKYASKPVTHAYADDEDLLDEAVRALRGKRFCNAFGTWRGLKLSAPPEDAKWERIAPLGAFLAKAKAGDAEAIAILERLGIDIPQGRAPPPIKSTPEQLAMWSLSTGNQWQAA